MMLKPEKFIVLFLLLLLSVATIYPVVAISSPVNMHMGCTDLPRTVFKSNYWSIVNNHTKRSRMCTSHLLFTRLMHLFHVMNYDLRLFLPFKKSVYQYINKSANWITNGVNSPNLKSKVKTAITWSGSAENLNLVHHRPNENWENWVPSHDIFSIIIQIMIQFHFLWNSFPFHLTQVKTFMLLISKQLNWFYFFSSSLKIMYILK